MKKYEYVNIEYSAKGVMFSYVEKHREIIDSYAEKGFSIYRFCPYGSRGKRLHQKN